MLCISCSFEIPAGARFALEQNQCPACGNQILDEETLAIIEDIENTIASEVKLREDTVKKIAILLVSKYNLGLDSSQQTQKPVSRTQPKPKTEVPLKVAPASVAKQLKENTQGIIKADDLMSELDREKILSEQAGKFYETEFVEDVSIDDGEQVNHQFPPEQVSALFAEGAQNPVLEKMRQAKMSKDRAGRGFFRRSS